MYEYDVKIRLFVAIFLKQNLRTLSGNMAKIPGTQQDSRARGVWEMIKCQFVQVYGK